MSYGRSFKAKYGSEACADCQNPIEPGHMVRFRYPEKALCHEACDTIQVEEAPYKLHGGSGYGCQGWTKGQVVKVDPSRYDGHQFLFVISAHSRYVREDGMSFGVGDEQGHLYSARCRPATEDEAAPIVEQIAKRQAAIQAKQRIAEIASEIRSSGEMPEGPVRPDGDRLIDDQNINGGGSWFVIGADHIWYIKNNGADGDDWTRNNVRTGGAGAIGWRVPFRQELADELRELSNN